MSALDRLFQDQLGRSVRDATRHGSAPDSRDLGNDLALLPRVLNVLIIFLLCLFSCLPDSMLLQAHSTATLRHDEDLQATLLNLLLRNYFNASLFDQADKLISKTTFPESAGNAQLARYLFYLGACLTLP